MASSEATATRDEKTKGRSYHDRLLEGMEAAVNEKGFAETTISDITRHARVSKRTFYEHFATKQECLLALYKAASERALARIADSIDPALGFDAQITKTATVYFSAMAESPSQLRTLLVEILAAGPRGLEVRRGIHRRYAELLCQLVDSVRGKGQQRYVLTPLMATAVVSGLHELLLEAIEEGRPERVGELSESAAEMLRAASTTVTTP